MAIIVREAQTLSSLYDSLQIPDGCIYDPDQVKRVKYAYSKGHQVASHTWAHLNLTTLSWDKSALVIYMLYHAPTISNFEW
jgi:hypothetical protein